MKYLLPLLRLPKRTRIALLVCTLFATAVIGMDKGAQEEPKVMQSDPISTNSSATSSPPVSPTSIAVLDVDKLQRTRPEKPPVDLFGPPEWHRPPPPPPPPVKIIAAPPPPPPPPTAPPLPYQVIGQLWQADGRRIFLAKGEENLSVKQGDTLDGIYKVEEVSTNAIVFSYLPLNIKQTLPLSDTQ